MSTVVPASAAMAPAFAIIYGADDRKESYDYDAQPEWDPALQSTGALMSPSVIDESDPTDVTFNAPTLAAYFDLCPSERFGDQSTPGFCSGFLIAENQMVTAGHCVENANDCGNTTFVFNYGMTSEGVRNTITADDIYDCQSVLTHIYVNGDDFAIVDLDRPVAGIEPALVRRGGMFEHAPAGPGVVAIGHPYGIPLKVADNAAAVEGRRDLFVANVDTFGGNSGSGVYGGATRELVGILVRGNNDWIDNGACNESAGCPDSGCVPPAGDGLEEAVRSNFLAPWTPARCDDGLCDPGEDEHSCPADCPQDSDYDLHPDVVDNCPFAPDPLQTNSDGDPLGDACDCDAGNGDAWQWRRVANTGRGAWPQGVLRLGHGMDRADLEPPRRAGRNERGLRHAALRRALRLRWRRPVSRVGRRCGPEQRGLGGEPAGGCGSLLRDPRDECVSARRDGPGRVGFPAKAALGARVPLIRRVASDAVRPKSSRATESCLTNGRGSRRFL
jgi:hypothetical protein